MCGRVWREQRACGGLWVEALRQSVCDGRDDSRSSAQGSVDVMVSYEGSLGEDDVRGGSGSEKAV